MSQRDDSEDDIWEYKPLEKKRKSSKSPRVCRRRSAPRKSPKKAAPISVEPKTEAAERGDPSAGGDASVLSSGEPPSSVLPRGQHLGTTAPSVRCLSAFWSCSPNGGMWPNASTTPGTNAENVQMVSGVPPPFQTITRGSTTHFSPKAVRAAPPAPSLSRQTDAGGEGSLGCFQEIPNNEALSFLSDLSPGRPHPRLPATESRRSASVRAYKRPSDAALPGPDDFKKKKGWLRNNKGQKAAGASQGKAETSSTPVKESAAAQACESSAKEEPFREDDEDDEDDDGISYSPLSELPAGPEVGDNCRKSLFPNEGSGNECSVMLFSDSFSSEDEILAQFIGNNCEDRETATNNPSSSSSQLYAVSSLAPTNEQAGSNRADAEPWSPSGSTISSSGLQSPQRIVLEQLRESLLGSEGGLGPKLSSPQVSTSQDSSVTKHPPMPPQKGQGKAGQAPGLKQTDIGVFFGLKPLKATENESGQSKPDASSVPASGKNPGRRRPRGDGQGKAGPSRAAEASQAAGLGNGSSSVGARGEAGKDGNRGWRRRWNRADAGGEVQLPRCPFYKKIPGTRFVVDAFRYGEIQGISTYFLTHFHSDHYGGLTRSSTFPIYCNRITGNLVKSKLRVAEQYLHILPMNTEVEVDGVRVILLDANHCPGAAMLLFLLPDGQTVLHTGDFRADPSMETYPQLLGCRVQTLYLDTTYCSPEYTFPRQREAINFAASTAFELVTLNPRTLVVCGSYSVGKEKVFLALAEVLGSKVCLSRDKYNTMCCLESQQIKARITTDWKAAQVHVLPMMQLSFNKLQQHLARFSAQYDRLVAFKPTGWTFSEQVESVEDIQPQISGSVSIYGIPYSEHSSFLELKQFVQWLKPLKIIPTVNVGSWSSRKAMEKCFSEWLSEARAKL